MCSLAQAVLRSWDDAQGRWWRSGEIVLFDEGAEVLLDAVWRWAGLPEDARSAAASSDMVAMVDAFGAVGPRNVRGRRARTRQERALSAVAEEVRAGRRTAPSGSVLDAAAWLRDLDGVEVDPWTLVPHGAGKVEHGHRCPGESGVERSSRCCSRGSRRSTPWCPSRTTGSRSPGCRRGPGPGWCCRSGAAGNAELLAGRDPVPYRAGTGRVALRS